VDGKRRFFLGTLLLYIFASGMIPAPAETDLEKLFSAPLPDKNVAFISLTFSGLIVRTPDGTIIVDPANLLAETDISVLKKRGVQAVLYTHGHGDHFAAGTARRLVLETGATIVADPAVAAALQKAGGIAPDKLIAAQAGQSVKTGGFTIHPITGKHIGPITLFHVQSGSVSVFHGGDSAYVPLGKFKADIAFLPTGAPSPTANPDAALQMALDVRPQAVVLMHGSDAQHADFVTKAKAKLPGTAVEIPEPFKFRVLALK
jgi:L-ascorbate metabolism protein UlaG (beta-lactamase superfamily)